MGDLNYRLTISDEKVSHAAAVPSTPVLRDGPTTKCFPVRLTCWKELLSSHCHSLLMLNRGGNVHKSADSMGHNICKGLLMHARSSMACFETLTKQVWLKLDHAIEVHDMSATCYTHSVPLPP